MKKEQITLNLIRESINSYSQETQDKIEEYEMKIKDIIKDGEIEAQLALALVSAELALNK